MMLELGIAWQKVKPFPYRLFLDKEMFLEKNIFKGKSTILKMFKYFFSYLVVGIY